MTPCAVISMPAGRGVVVRDHAIDATGRQPDAAALSASKARSRRRRFSTSTAAVLSSAIWTVTTTSAPSFAPAPASTWSPSTTALRRNICTRLLSTIAARPLTGPAASTTRPDRAVRRECRRQSCRGRRACAARPSACGRRPGADLSQPRRRYDHAAPMIEHADAPMLSTRDLAVLSRCAVRRRRLSSQTRPSRRSPTADFSGLPPTVIVTAQCDPLSSDGESLSRPHRGRGRSRRVARGTGPDPQLSARPAFVAPRAARHSTGIVAAVAALGKASGRTESPASSRRLAQRTQ